MTQDPKETIDLYLHVDKKVDMVGAQLGTIREVEIELKKTLERLEQRVDHGIARTGQENKQTLNEHSIKLNDLSHDMRSLGEAIKNTNESLGKAISEVGAKSNLIYKGIVGIFFTVILAGFVGFVFKQLPIWLKP